MRSLFGLIIGLVVSLSLVAFAGEAPFQVLRILVSSGLGSWEDFALSLFYTTSLMFTGLAVALSFRGGLFNIGAEGQLSFAALFSCLVSLSLIPVLPLNALGIFLGFTLPIFLCFFAGAFWGGIAGVLKAYRGSHEVVVTIMLNFVAAGLLSYFVVGPFQNPDSQNPETSPLPGALHWTEWDPFRRILPDSPLNLSFLIALFLCLFFYWVFRKRVLGFEWRVLGAQPNVARNQGIRVRRMSILILAISGGIAGLVALNDIYGSAGKLRLGFSPEYGFIGIAVALLARNHPLGVIPAAFLFGLLHKGAADLDLETELINRDFAKIIQAIIVLSVIACSALPIPRWLRFWKKEGPSKI